MSTDFTADDLVGRWDIVSWEQVYDDGRVQLPLGSRLNGFIRYTSDGDMACLITKAERAPFRTGGQWDADDAEKATAYGSMLAYAGSWSLDVDGDGPVVTHKVDMSLFPNWVGGQQRRRISLQPDGSITLEARLEDGTSEARTARLAWRRHNSEGQA
ncbi:lipocalin-like domain-containing protein [Streptomyces sp. NPDC101455]|uniref:lipocalin-like domain-containing protein n=1 Tax=Streptomyces sp. NPDC101455 TaxID=3366142 RepID=UPI0037FA7258